MRYSREPALKGQGSCSGLRSQRVAELDGPPGGLVHLFLKSRQPGAPVLRVPQLGSPTVCRVGPRVTGAPPVGPLAGPDAVVDMRC